MIDGKKDLKTADKAAIPWKRITADSYVFSMGWLEGGGAEKLRWDTAYCKHRGSTLKLWAGSSPETEIPVCIPAGY